MELSEEDRQEADRQRAVLHAVLEASCDSARCDAFPEDEGWEGAASMIVPDEIEDPTDG